MEIADVRHLLRRLTFAATPPAEQALRPLSVEAAVASITSATRRAPQPAAPDFVSGVWTNTALRVAGMTDAQHDALRAAQLTAAQHDIERLRQWWVGGMIGSAAPLRETLTLFFHGTFGSSSASVDIPHALHGCNARLRRLCLGTIPDLLEELVVDPAMMIQIGMDEHGRVRASDRPAKLILDHWTVGAGEYADRDIENLSRALTGWTLVAPRGGEPAAAVDPRAVRPARRTGLVPVFDAKEFDDRPKTILGTTQAFDARSAMRFLGLHPATARRVGRHLIQYFGVEDPRQRLEARLVAAYQSTSGSVEALIGEIARSEEFWSADTRWSLIKSPVHLAVGACRQLNIGAPPLEEISLWLKAAGQTLFDTPNGGEGGWPGGDTWVTPPDRLAIRYQLPVVLSGRAAQLGLQGAARADGKGPPMTMPLDAALRSASARALLARLDPAPGLDARLIEQAATRVDPGGRHAEMVRRIMATPQYQVA